jgi:hypothetical protein
MRIGGGRTVGLVLAALVAARVVDRAVPGSHLAVGLGLAACLLAIARALGLTAADLGLARSTWPAGLRWGAAAAALVGRRTPWPPCSRPCARPSQMVRATSGGRRCGRSWW